MPLYVDDYLADTGHLTALEHGAYMLMIMHYWQKGGLPEDERMIARVARLSLEQWAESRDVLEMLFEPGWRHKRIEEELAKATEIIGKRKAAATAMHAKRSASAEQVQSTCSDTGVPPSPSPVKEAPSGASKSRATRLPADWRIPEPWLLEAIAAGLTRAQAEAEASKMLNWSLSDRNGAKLNWLAAWRNWFARAPRPRGGAPPGQRRVTDEFLDDAKRMGLIDDDEPPSTFERRVDQSDGTRQGSSPGITRRFAITSDILGKA